MIAWGKLPTGKVFHGWEPPDPRKTFTTSRVLRSLCGLWRERWKLGGYPMTRKCKTCKRFEGYHMKRPPRI